MENNLAEIAQGGGTLALLVAIAWWLFRRLQRAEQRLDDCEKKHEECTRSMQGFDTKVRRLAVRLAESRQRGKTVIPPPRRRNDSGADGGSLPTIGESVDDDTGLHEILSIAGEVEL